MLFRFASLSPVSQVFAAALARLASVALYDLLTFVLLHLTGAQLQGSVWVSALYFPAALIVFFVFTGSLWAVAGIALGSFIYATIVRDLPLPMDALLAMPSAAALLITMIFQQFVFAEGRGVRLFRQLAYWQIATVSAIYAFWNFTLYYVAFSLYSDALQTVGILNLPDMAAMFAGDFAGSAILLSLARFFAGRN